MPIRTKVTTQGQTSVPLEVRRKLGIGPGSVLEWEHSDDAVIVRRATRYTSEDIHRRLFGDKPPKRRDLKEFKKGIEKDIKKRHARD